MAFDSQTRNRLARFVADARELIADEFTQKFQSLYGLSSSGEITAVADLKHLDEAQCATTERLRARLRHLEPEAGDSDRVKPDTIEHLAREQAFTVLNRLAAIRMAEKRGIIVESVGRGYESKGFKVFLQVAGNALGDAYHKYRRYLLCLFDELAVDLGALFDRRSSTGLLFLREPALLQFLDLLNAPDLEPLWAEDETIGWIYQYYNDPAERKKMREQSSAPRNSRELAVRNQFFTPRYVVEFLTDNTLGRIWFEMTKGQTRLKEQCRYLVRRPNEVFLRDGEIAPEPTKSADENLSQEELLKQPVHIPHRHLKDPRSIRMLDPACGSMHFGLYSFDLFEVIYDEAWEFAHHSDDTLKSSEAFAPFIAFVAQYPGKTAFLREVPHLIIEHNIHGIDIDPRCAQIAGLSLWLRAQRTWQQQRLQVTDRPRVRRSNIVCAEPMPGEEEFLNEFIEAQFSGTPEKNLLGQLVRRVFEAMKLAGEAGSLLKIEDEIAGAVAEAKRKWLAGPKLEQGRLFADDFAPPMQKELGLDVTGIADDTFWEKAEERIYAALRAYAEQADHGGGYQRRLFADDAARGFAFIDLCRKRYDVVLMNPPFGDPPRSILGILEAGYSEGKWDVATAFVVRAAQLSSAKGGVGVISTRIPLFTISFEGWRRQILVDRGSLCLMADLGGAVLDDAMVETAAYCITVNGRNASPSVPTVFIPVYSSKLGAAALAENSQWIAARLESFEAIPGFPLAYWLPGEFLTLFKHLESFEPAYGRVCQGLGTTDDFRFCRLRFEVSVEALGSFAPDDQLKTRNLWVPYVKGENFAPYYDDYQLTVNWASNGLEVKEFNRQRYGSASRNVKSEDFYGRPGLVFPRRTKRFVPRFYPEGMIFSVGGQSILPNGDPLLTLGYTSTSIASTLVRAMLGRVDIDPQFEVGVIKRLPFPQLRHCANEIVRNVKEAVLAISRVLCCNETATVFRFPHWRFDGVSLSQMLLDLRDYFEAQKCSLGKAHEYVEEIVAKELGLSLGALMYARQGFDLERQDFWCLHENGFVHQMLSYWVGICFGRWDIRFATGEKPAPDLPDPFAPLPVCPPGQLQNEKGLPLTKDDARHLLAAGQWHYPLELPLDGIVVDDSGHQLDIETRVHQVLQVIWKGDWEAIEREACEILGVRTLRDYFRKPAGFFADHLKRYSKSRRQAPIYWPLSTASGSYTLWVYYHRLTDQTLHTALADFVDPKIKSIELDAQRQKGEGRTEKYGESIEFLDELKELRAEIERIIKIPWKPNLNDGVLITASPLWKLFRHANWQKDLMACWEKLEAGAYDWAHLAYTIWPDRVKDKCKTDRSLAIAHGLEALCTVQALKPKKEKTPKQQTSEDESEDLLQAEAVLGAAPNPTKEPKADAKKDSETRQTPIDQTDRADVLCAIRQLFNDGQARDRDTAVHDLSTALGYQRVGSRIREILHTGLLTAVRRGILQNQDGQLSLLARDLRDYQRDFLKENFLSAIGRAWTEREEAIRAFARWLGFSRIGPVVEETGYSLINGLLRDRRLEAEKDQIRRVAG